MNPTSEELVELRARITRVCDNCEGNPTKAPFAPYSCPECHDEPGKTSDPNVSVEEVRLLIDEVERLRAKIEFLKRNECCCLMLHTGVGCGDCSWSINNPDDDGGEDEDDELA